MHKIMQNQIEPASIENVSRRGMLRSLGLTAGLVLAMPLLPRRGMAAYSTGAGKMPHGTVNDPRIFVSIAPDGVVTIIAHRSEMGTGSRTGLPMVVADEMEADWSRVRVRQAPGDEVKDGNQDTDGSRSTRHYLVPMRQIGAAARMMLEAAAAKRWNVAVSEVKANNHEVVHVTTGRKLGTATLRRMPLPRRSSRQPNCSLRILRISATSARAGSALSICTTSPPARRSMAATHACRD